MSGLWPPETGLLLVLREERPPEAAGCAEDVRELLPPASLLATSDLHRRDDRSPTRPAPGAWGKKYRDGSIGARLGGAGGSAGASPPRRGRLLGHTAKLGEGPDSGRPLPNENEDGLGGPRDRLPYISGTLIRSSAGHVGIHDLRRRFRLRGSPCHPRIRDHVDAVANAARETWRSSLGFRTTAYERERALRPPHERTPIKE